LYCNIGNFYLGVVRESLNNGGDKKINFVCIELRNVNIRFGSICKCSNDYYHRDVELKTLFKRIKLHSSRAYLDCNLLKTKPSKLNLEGFVFYSSTSSLPWSGRSSKISLVMITALILASTSSASSGLSRNKSLTPSLP